jgi:hypothetical protein
VASDAPATGTPVVQELAGPKQLSEAPLAITWYE